MKLLACIGKRYLILFKILKDQIIFVSALYLAIATNIQWSGSV